MLCSPLSVGPVPAASWRAADRRQSEAGDAGIQTPSGHAREGAVKSFMPIATSLRSVCVVAVYINLSTVYQRISCTCLSIVSVFLSSAAVDLEFIGHRPGWEARY